MLRLKCPGQYVAVLFKFLSELYEFLRKPERGQNINSFFLSFILFSRSTIRIFNIMNSEALNKVC